MFTQRLIHLTLTSITTLALCYSATGGELLPTLILAIPLGVVFATSGFVGGLLALCGSLSGVTGLYALMNQLSQQVSIPPLMTYFAVSLMSIALAVRWRHFSPGVVTCWAVRSSPLAVVPPLIALISGYLVLQWTRYSDLEFLNALGGSEDNAAWISGTRTFIAGEMTTQFLAHPTAKSPVTGTTLGFVSDVYWIAQSDTPGHLLALRALRSAYALIIALSALAAGMWIYVVATRVKVSEWLGAFASLVVAVAILGSSLYLFIGVGFFSFINGVLFAFVVAIGLEVAYSKAPFTHQLGGILILVLGGFAGAWWGVTVLVVALVVIVGTSPQLRMRWSGQSRSDRCFSLVSWLLALSTLLWTWTISMGGKIEVGHIGSTGTVPIVETMWFPVILFVVVALVARVADSHPNWRQRALHLTLALYVVLIWLVTMFEYAEPRYAAFKILVLLSLLTMVGLGVVLIERARSFGWPGVLVGLAMVVLWSSLVHESHNGVRGIGRSPSTTTVQSRILETLNQNVDADIVCLHQDPDLRIAAYLCSRLSASFSPGKSPALDNWTQALLNPDISPNGIEMPRESHIGSRVLSEIHRETLRTDLVVILIGGSNAEGIVKDLGPDFWWVNELKWSEISTVHL